MMLNEARLDKIVSESIKSVLMEEYESEKKAAWDKIKSAKKKVKKDPESRESAKELSDAHNELENVNDKYEKWTTKGKLYNDHNERTGTYKSKEHTKKPRNKRIWREDN